MKKVIVFLAVVLAVVAASGPALSTPIAIDMHIDLNGVAGANKVWIWDRGNDDKITAPVNSNWNYERVLSKGLKIRGSDNLADDVLEIDFKVADTFQGTLRYAIFSKGKLSGWGNLIYDKQLEKWVQEPKNNLRNGVVKIANWSFGGLVKFASGDDTNGTQLTQVPEPATMLLLGIGLIGVSVYARRRFKTN